ncbi:MAG: phosphosulfolactate synthase [Rhodospirillales bacterium]
MKYAFDFLDVDMRAGKPRTTGLTIVRDRMRGLGEQREFLETYAQFVDFVKISNFAPRLYAETFLRSKIDLYSQFEVPAMFGGILFENAFAQGKVDRLRDYLVDIAAPAVEISNNIIDIDTREMARHIREFAGAGLTVFAEWGKKYPDTPLDPEQAANEIGPCIEAGAAFVIIERAEIDLLVGGDAPSDGIERLVRLHDLVGSKFLIFEAEFQAQMVALLRALGRNVNLGPNIDFEIVKWLEPSRLGISREMGHRTIEGSIGVGKVRSSIGVG